MINSLLIVCFYNSFKKIKSVNIYKIRGKIVCNGYKSTIMEYCDRSTIISRGILPILSIICFTPID